MSVIKKYDLYHTVIPPWIYRIPSELRSQAGLGLPSTVVGDHTGIVGAVCFLYSVKICLHNFTSCLFFKVDIGGKYYSYLFVSDYVYHFHQPYK